MSSIRQKRPIYLAIIWHQHQPLYVDAQQDCLIGPWVRTHGTKDYYDMAAMIERFPHVHCTINLTTSLVHQLQHFYVDRLGPCIDLKSGSFDLVKYRKEMEGTIDPWIDLLVKPAEEFDEVDRDYLYRNPWSAVSISEVLLERFPEYERLKFRFSNGNGEEASVQEMRELKFWFFLAYFDPDFLNGPVRLPSGDVCDLSGMLQHRDSKYFLKHPVTQTDCLRLLVDVYRVLVNILPAHRRLQYHPETHKGQIEIITTPYTHPILPLLYDSDVARVCQPNDALPARFAFPGDADTHIRKAIIDYKKLFGEMPVGMWPAEGSVSQEIVPLFAQNGIRWIATDQHILQQSKPQGRSHCFPYRLQTDWADVVILFRDTHLSDKVGFTYQTMRPEDAAEDFVNSVCALGDQDQEQDKLVTVILDGENAWEWYRFDHDAKRFLSLVYEKLEQRFASGEIVTVTPAEYLLGNRERGVPAHHPSGFSTIDWLWPGSWINANFDTWIGEEEENLAWGYLLQARRDLERAGVSQPDADAVEPQPDTKEWYAFHAWEELYAAEGSDWFWWYGEDQNAPGGDKPFDVTYFTHLRSIYKCIRLYGARIEEPELKEIIQQKSKTVPQRRRKSGGTMARGIRETVPVLFRCTVPDGVNARAVCIVGNREELGEWVPNRVRMANEGSGKWMFEAELPLNAEIHYKYTCDGIEGQWHPGDERVGWHRTLKVHNATKIVVDDTFGNVSGAKEG